MTTQQPFWDPKAGPPDGRPERPMLPPPVGREGIGAKPASLDFPPGDLPRVKPILLDGMDANGRKFWGLPFSPPIPDSLPYFSCEIIQLPVFTSPLNRNSTRTKVIFFGFKYVVLFLFQP